MRSGYVRPPHGWDEYQRDRRDRRERREAQVDAMRRRADEGLSYERALHGYRVRRAVAVGVLVLVVAVVVLTSLLPASTVALVTGGALLLVVALATAVLWRLVVGVRPTLRLTDLPDRAPRHPAFEQRDGQTSRRPPTPPTG